MTLPGDRRMAVTAAQMRLWALGWLPVGQRTELEGIHTDPWVDREGIHMTAVGAADIADDVAGRRGHRGRPPQQDQSRRLHPREEEYLPGGRWAQVLRGQQGCMLEGHNSDQKTETCWSGQCRRQHWRMSAMWLPEGLAGLLLDLAQAEAGAEGLLGTADLASGFVWAHGTPGLILPRFRDSGRPN